MTTGRRITTLFAAVVLTVAGAVFAALPASAASLQQITNFGTNPSNIKMYLQTGWIRTRYGTQVEAIQETGQPHNLQIVADQAIHFFGLDSTGTPPPASSPGSGGLVEGFESGGNGWSAGGVSGGPWQVSEWAAQGGYSLKADVALGGGKSYSLSKVAALNLSGGSTLRATVRAATWGALGSGLTAKLYVKTGSSYTWYDTAVSTVTTGTGGTVLSLGLSGVANRSDVREIGVQFFAASNSSGTTSIYLDNVTVA